MTPLKSRSRTKSKFMWNFHEVSLHILLMHAIFG
ncbi:unnamed protein product [Spirodela intermedia]|uniref:Uncharacterized protein n=1 Tax=Spirodela intermedia TaxID=51605 RepID=A0A7I8IK44_SPIIN|nr:unnamed protein product [Spirodela intermedia]CAA6658260.1 unnamed protein product [Spirodela intermedia]